MTRREDWPLQLERAIEAARSRPFEWGVHDCATFACNVVLAMTGCDPMGGHRGAYRSLLGAVRETRRFCGLINMATRAFGDPVRALEARRGDVVLLCRDNGPALGVCLDHRAAFVSMAGLVFPRLSDCEQAWHV